MVARGDLAVELGIENLPDAQLKIVRAAKNYGKQVTIATDILGGMIADGYPTRSNAADVMLAVFLEADSVMTSGETASDVPGAAQAAVKMMRDLLSSSESAVAFQGAKLRFEGYTVPRSLTPESPLSGDSFARAQGSP